MKTFYFNTGVQSYMVILPLMKGHIIKGGTMQIPFDCDDVPNKATFLYAQDTPPEIQHPNIIFREMHNTAMVSKYAFFRI